MGSIARILFFIIGAVALILTGLVGASQAGVDTNALLMHLGDTPGGVASSAEGYYGSGLQSLGAMLANVLGQTDPDHPGLVQQWAPTGLAGLVSLLVMVVSARRD